MSIVQLIVFLSQPPALLFWFTHTALINSIPAAEGPDLHQVVTEFNPMQTNTTVHFYYTFNVQFLTPSYRLFVLYFSTEVIVSGGALTMTSLHYNVVQDNTTTNYDFSNKHRKKRRNLHISDCQETLNITAELLWWTAVDCTGVPNKVASEFLRS